MADSVKMLFVVAGLIGPRNEILDASPDAPREAAFFGGNVTYRENAASVV